MEMRFFEIQPNLHISTYPQHTVSLPEMLRLNERNGLGSPKWLPKGKKMLN